MNSELRRNPITGGWVIMAPERAQRPAPFRHYPASSESPSESPFATGREHLTPPEVLAFRPAGGEANGPGWTVRVVPNLYPALRIEGSTHGSAEGLYDRMGAVGAHEVVIESPDPDKDTKDLPVAHVADVIRAFRTRMVDLYGDSRFRYVLGFKNRGAAAGATIDHPHGQVIALPIVPSRIERELAGAERYFDLRGRCAFCDIIDQETRDGSRVVVQNRSFIALAPYASRFPFEVMILPLDHEAFFWTMTQTEMVDLAEILRDVLRRYAFTLDDPAYNFMIHGAPQRYGLLERYHWHLVMMPKLVEVAGFEWASGLNINPVTPEDAADRLRNLEQVMAVPPDTLL